MPVLRGRRGLSVLILLAVVSLFLLLRSSLPAEHVPIVDDYAPYNKPPSRYGKTLLPPHDTEIFDTGSKWVPDTWKPSSWLPALPFLPSTTATTTTHHADGKRGRVLVTGGAGALGLPLVARLLDEGFAVTMHDLRDPGAGDVAYLRGRNGAATEGGRLVFVRGDIMSRRHLAALMQELVAPATKKKKKKGKSGGPGRPGGGLVGVVHLAGVARHVWCSSRVEECERVNVQGTTYLFNALAAAAATQSSPEKPWFLHVSSLDVYARSTGSVPSRVDADELTALGKTKLLAEQALKEAYTTHRDLLADGSGIRTIVLRPSTIYGAPTDIQDRLVPALVKNALADLPVQVLRGDVVVDFLHVDDAVEGLVRAVERLGGVDPGDAVAADDGREASSAQGSRFELTEGHAEPITKRIATPQPTVRNGLMFEVYDLVSGYTATPRQLLDMVMSLTQSVSPIQDYTSQLPLGKSVKTPLMALDVPDGLRRDLGFQAAISLEQGIAAYVNTLREGFTDWAKEYLGAECPASPLYGDPAVVHPADRRNKNLHRLAGCTANIGVNHEGWIHHVKCGDSACGADNIKTSSFNWNQSIFTILPHGQETSGVVDRAEDAEDGTNGKWAWAFGMLGADTGKEGSLPMRVQFEEKNSNKVLGFTRAHTAEGTPEYAHLGLFDHAVAAASENIVSVFEPRVANNASYLQFTIPGTDEYLAVEALREMNRFSVKTLEKTSAFDFRMTLLCCPTDKPWPLLLDDYETADFRYGSTGDIPFDSSKRSHECKRVEMALERMESLLSPAPTESGLGMVQRPLAVTTTKQPHDWILRGLPTCMNHCGNPMICVQNGHCRCIQADECPVERANPLTPLELPRGNKLISITTNEDFVKAVGKLRWQDVLLPSALRVLETYPELIKVHVVSGYENEEEIEAAPCHKLASNHCFSADSIMYRAMRTISVPANEADLIIVPIYQHCDGAPFLLHDVIEYASKTIPDFVSRPVSLVLTHDWGICIDFAWNIWEARTNHRLHPEGILNNVFVWSVMGDTVSDCYRPHMDTVIPARTCLSVKLKEMFGDLSMIRPTAQRPHLLTWAGTMWGTGKSARMRLVCDRGGVASEELVPGGGPQSAFLNWHYMKDLSDARFCPQPTGIAGWSFRIQDAIYAGCIPVFMSDGTHYPYADILDYSKFSVRVSPTEFDHLEHVLRAIPLEKVESMQAHLIAAREAFLYSTDEHPEGELERKGPLWFALQSARVRLSTEYPTSEVPVTAE